MAFEGQIAVVGATGVVGGEVLARLAERRFEPDQVSCYAADRSIGAEVEFGGETLEVEKLETDALRRTAVVFLCVPEAVAREWAPRLQGAGAWVVDASSAFRSDAQVPLAVPGRPVARPARGRIVACASPVAAALAQVLQPLHAHVRIASGSVTALLGASSAGTGGLAELERQTMELMSGKDPEPSIFPHRLAFNLVPQVGALDPQGTSAEEASWGGELVRLWAGAPPMAGSAIQFPGFFGHLVTLDLELSQAAEPGAVREWLKAAPGLKVLDAPSDRVYPMPMLVSEDASVHVGRIRTAPGRPNRLLLALAFEGAHRAGTAALDAAEGLMAV